MQNKQTIYENIEIKNKFYNRYNNLAKKWNDLKCYLSVYSHMQSTLYNTFMIFIKFCP